MYDKIANQSVLNGLYSYLAFSIYIAKSGYCAGPVKLLWNGRTNCRPNSLTGIKPAPQVKCSINLRFPSKPQSVVVIGKVLLVVLVGNLKHVNKYFIGRSPEADISITNGEVDLIYGSPEVLVGNVQRREILQKLDVGLIVIDEFHTIATW